MSIFQERIVEIETYFHQANQHLGFRTLVDLVLDTEDVQLFYRCIEHASFQEKFPDDKDKFSASCLLLLNDMKRLSPKEASTGEVLIIADKIEKQYSKSTFSMGPIDLQIKSGQLIGLVGENGNGKTTLLRILAKELTYSSGECKYLFQKKEVSDYDLRTELIYIPQRTPKWYGPVKDNLKLAATQYGIRPEDNEAWVLMLIIRFGLWSFRNHRWGQLSSGYKMRFELARTFLRRPKLLLLDEPLANLDILSQQLILEDLKLLGKSISRPLAIVLSSQQLYEVEKVSDEVIFLQQGKSSSFNALKDRDANEASLVVELEVGCERATLFQAIEHLELISSELIGSNYYLEFKNAKVNQLLEALLANKISIKYFRDISFSTRRFFQK